MNKPARYSGQFIFMQGRNKELLTTITNDILKAGNGFSEMRDASFRLFQFFISITGLDPYDLHYNSHLKTKGGLAVNWYSAAFCVVDFMRTVRFMQAVEAAVRERLSADANKPVVLLYAGTGPFATLALPLITRFTPGQLQFVFIELNPTSYGYLKKSIQALDADDYIRGAFNVDAFQFEIPQHCQPHILLSETMKPALHKEPQVSLVAHLIKQCRPDVLMIPQCIRVNLLYRANPFQYDLPFFPVKTLLALDAELLRKIGDGQNLPDLFTRGEPLQLPEFPNEAYNRVDLFTYIQLYGSIHLDYNECSLTIAHVFDPQTKPTAPGTYKVQYIMGEKPGFVFTRV